MLMVWVVVAGEAFGGGAEVEGQLDMQGGSMRGCATHQVGELNDRGASGGGGLSVRPNGFARLTSADLVGCSAFSQHLEALGALEATCIMLHDFRPPLPWLELGTLPE